ncbi:MAG: VOC family protein [Acidobacteriota bacterium]
MRLAHTMIRVRDLEATLDFYENFIGLREIRRKKIGHEATLVWISDGGAYSIELTFNHDQPDYVQGNQFGHLAFKTKDLEAVVKDVESRGWWYRRSRPQSPSRYIFVKDPDGYDVEIIQE